VKDGDKRVFDDLAMYAYLLTSKTDNSDLFYHVKQIIQFNISIQWMTAQTERTGKAIKELIDAGPRMGNGTLYDCLTILFNLLTW